MRQFLRWNACGRALEEWQMRIARQAKFETAEVSEVLLRVQRNMHGGDMNVAPGALHRMRGGKSGGAAHGHEHVDHADAKLGCARAVAHRARAQLQGRR